MKIDNRISSLVFFIILYPFASYSQTVINLKLQKDTRGEIIVDPASAVKSKQAINASGTQPVDLSIACTNSTDCAALKVYFVSQEDKQGMEGDKQNSSTDSALWRFIPSLWENKTNPALSVRLKAENSLEIEIINIPLNITNPDNEQPSFALTEKISSLLSVDCRNVISTIVEDHKSEPYSEAANRAYFVVTPYGNVLLRPDPIIDEDDIVIVTVVAHKKLLPLLRIKRTSAFRTPGVLNIVGADQNIPSLVRPKSDPGGRPCDCVTVQLSDFQPGRAEVSLSILGEEGEVSTGSFDFGVNTLYSGAFSFGAVHTQLKNPSFGLVLSSGDSVITETEDGAPRVLYALTYTPFIWGKRDLEKDKWGTRNLFNWRRINPMLGIVLNDVDQNFIAGLSYDLVSMVYFTFGAHWGKVRKLDPESNLKTGDPFIGTSDKIPVVREWDGDYFFGLSLDLRAATQFLNKAFGGGVGK